MKNSDTIESLPVLLEQVITDFSEILRGTIYEGSFSAKEVRLRREKKRELRQALRKCVCGDEKAKIYVKDSIRELLLRKYKIDQEKIEKFLPFSSVPKLSIQDKFDILLYALKKEYGIGAIEYLIEEYELAKQTEKEGTYCVYAEQIEDIFEQNYFFLNFYDKLSIIVQRLYQQYRGNGVIDELLTMKLDGISGGVSGIPEYLSIENNIEKKACDSVWIFYKGKSIHLEFLSFGSFDELRRVCKNICRYHHMGQLSARKGYLVTELADGSRVAVARPPFSETWVFFIRKFNNEIASDLTKLLTDTGSDKIIQILKWIISGQFVTGITGEQGAGKTTLLSALIHFIPTEYNLRVQELSSELHLRRLYPERNIVSFKETPTIDGVEGLDFQKKSDGTVQILGEVASASMASLLISISLNASLFTLFTHHAKTTEDLIAYLRNALLTDGGFRDEQIAVEQVVHAIDFDIHMAKSKDGKRFIERITEIIPLKNSGEKNTYQQYETRVIVEFQNGEYQIKQGFSQEKERRLSEILLEEEWNFYQKKKEE